MMQDKALGHVTIAVPRESFRLSAVNTCVKTWQYKGFLGVPNSLVLYSEIIETSSLPRPKSNNDI